MDQKKDRMKTTAVVVGIILLYFLLRNVGTSACHHKLVDLITKCEMYATDHNGHSPSSLTEIGNGFCPGSFYNCIVLDVSPQRGRYFLRCDGGHWQRRGFREGYPYYDSNAGWCLGPNTWSNLAPEEYLRLHNNPKL